MIDTHTHLYSEEFDNDFSEMLQRAINKGVTEFYLPAIDSKSHLKMINLETNILIKFSQ
jgi:TatD DNase family protein